MSDVEISTGRRKRSAGQSNVLVSNDPVIVKKVVAILGGEYDETHGGFKWLSDGTLIPKKVSYSNSSQTMFSGKEVKRHNE